MLPSFLFFAGGLALLLFSGDVLTRASLRLAVLLRVQPLTAGLTITAFATSMPEAMIGIDAAIGGAIDIVLGNVIGSNIANIFLVLGVPALFLSLPTNIPRMRRQALMMLGASFMFLALAASGGINFIAGIGFLLLTGAWLFYSFLVDGADEDSEFALEEDPFLDDQPLWLAIGALILSVGGLWGGAHLTLIGAEGFVHLFGLSEAVVGLTLIAIGTSLPELATSIAAVWRRRADIALGNILGSNLFNILFVLGLAAVITPLGISKPFMILDLPVMLIAALLLMPFVLTRRPLSRFVGAGFIFLYGLYIWSLYAIRPEML